MSADDAELEDEIRRSHEKRERFRRDMETAMADPDNKRSHPRPWTAILAIHDGVGVQFLDALGKPVLGPDLMRDPDDAAQLLHAVNTGE